MQYRRLAADTCHATTSRQSPAPTELGSHCIHHQPYSIFPRLCRLPWSVQPFSFFTLACTPHTTLNLYSFLQVAMETAAAKLAAVTNAVSAAAGGAAAELRSLAVPPVGTQLMLRAVLLALGRQASELATWVQIRWAVDHLVPLAAGCCRCHKLLGSLCWPWPGMPASWPSGCRSGG